MFLKIWLATGLPAIGAFNIGIGVSNLSGNSSAGLSIGIGVWILATSLGMLLVRLNPDA